MLEFVMSVIPGGWLTAILTALGAVALAAWRLFAAGKASERAKQDAARHRARDTADKIDRDIDQMSAQARRDALKKWSPK